jgi:hypothetical protein
MGKSSQQPSSFKHWDIDALAEKFGLLRTKNHQVLTAWLEQAEAAAPEVSPEHRALIVDLADRLSANVDMWNEEELKVQFIGPLVFWADYTDTRYKVFLERPLAATINGIEVSGDVDFMLATGLSRPKEPFFFLHEYKRQHRGDNDPFGQLLIAMLAARELNSAKHPMYGAVVQGLNWFFVIVDKNHYAVSDVYISTNKDDIFRIIAVLRYMKVIIDGLLTGKSQELSE